MFRERHDTCKSSTVCERKRERLEGGGEKKKNKNGKGKKKKKKSRRRRCRVSLGLFSNWIVVGCIYFLCLVFYFYFSSGKTNRKEREQASEVGPGRGEWDQSRVNKKKHRSLLKPFVSHDKARHYLVVPTCSWPFPSKAWD